MTDPHCIFCKIVSKEIEASIIYEDDTCLAFMDITPVTKGHALVVPKQHYANLSECDDEVLRGVISVVRKISPAVKNAMDAEGILLQTLEGSAAGQEVFHLHFHIIPRTTGDGLILFPKKAMQERDALNDLAESIKAELK
jgi:histidine triad (HIT) family protein